MAFASIDDMCHRTTKWPITIQRKDVRDSLPQLDAKLAQLAADMSRNGQPSIFMTENAIVVIGPVAKTNDGYAAEIRYARIYEKVERIPDSFSPPSF